MKNLIGCSFDTYINTFRILLASTQCINKTLFNISIGIHIISSVILELTLVDQQTLPIQNQFCLLLFFSQTAVYIGVDFWFIKTIHGLNKF